MSFEKDLGFFLSFLNASADTKGRGHLTIDGMKPYWEDMYVTKAVEDNEDIVMHAHIFDKKLGRALLLQSASLFRNEENSHRRNFIGRANRWLHYRDMLFFKSIGASVYDFGGYAKGAEGNEQARINDFKMKFGGDIVEESNYISWPVIFYNFIKGQKVPI